MSRIKVVIKTIREMDEENLPLQLQAWRMAMPQWNLKNVNLGKEALVCENREGLPVGETAKTYIEILRES